MLVAFANLQGATHSRFPKGKRDSPSSHLNPTLCSVALGRP